MKFNDITGQQFGRLTVIARVPHDGEPRWKCKCTCGNYAIVRTSSLVHGGTKSCGCLSRERIAERCGYDLVGQRFGRLVVLERAGSDNHNNYRWKCKCDCGNIVYTTSAQLSKGGTKSCGCFRKEILANSHKKYDSPEIRYLAVRKFSSMKDRCENPDCKSYPNYGGRGITICEEWRNDPVKFAEWALANGYKPGLSIDRIDNNGPYSPENCRFSDDEQQALNKRNNRYITVHGVSKTISQWADELGIERTTLYVKSDEKVQEYLETIVKPATGS